MRGTPPVLSDEIRELALKQLQNDVDHYTIYSILAQLEKKEENKKIFLELALEEKNHYDFGKYLTGEDRKSNNFLILFTVIMTRIFGTLFVLKFMESREIGTKSFYKHLFDTVPEAREIYEQEINHEIELINMLHDKKIAYAGAIVLGMNDALVELTGAISGLAFAFDKTVTVGATGLIMGVAASLSLAGSAYLESKESGQEDINPLTYSLYTGVTYIFTTAMLILPFFILDSMALSIVWMFSFALIAICLYNFYISVAKSVSFWERVTHMSAITFGVAIISFGIGFLVKHYLGIDV